MSKGEYYEYSSAADITLPNVPVEQWMVKNEFTETEEKVLDLSDAIKTDYKATTPNLRASFHYIKKDNVVVLSAKVTSHVFHVIYGCGKLVQENISWKEGDIFTCPSGEVVLKAEEDSALYTINDNPLLQYLGVSPDKKLFEATLYSKTELEKNMKLLTDPTAGRNREGILLGNSLTRENTKTITPTLWALYNKLPKNSFQKPHRHNSVAIDYCIYSGGNVYTLIGNSLQEDGSIKNPKKVYWKTRSVFTTPPGLWHSHHNESDEDAFVLPLQDAGLYTYQRTLDIQFQE